MTKTTIIMDASAFKDSSCILRTFNTVVLGYKEKVNNNDIEFGTAFHKFRSHYRTTGDVQTSLMLAQSYYKNTQMWVKSNKKYLTTEFLLSTCYDWIKKWGTGDDLIPIVHDGKKLIEPHTRFSFPYYVDDEVEVIIAGTIDELATYHGENVIVDAKTTSVWDTVKYFRGYELSPQLITYRWAIRKYADAFPGSILDVIDSAGCYAMIEGIFYKGADKPVEFVRSKLFPFSESSLIEFDFLIQLKVKELIFHIKQWRLIGVIPFRFGLLNGSCQTPYGECKYFNACAAPDDESRESVMMNQFKQEIYNPLNFGV